MAFNAELYKDLNFKEKYSAFLNEIEEYLSKESDPIANLANASAFITAFFDEINWCGFYLLKKNELVLGPFCGMPATTRIQIGNGVCGTSVERKEKIVVENVCEFPGHITCDVRSKSEVVIPLIKNEKIYGVLDIDSAVYSRFSSEEVEILEKAVAIINKYTDYEKITY